MLRLCKLKFLWFHITMLTTCYCFWPYEGCDVCQLCPTDKYEPCNTMKYNPEMGFYPRCLNINATRGIEFVNHTDHRLIYRIPQIYTYNKYVKRPSKYIEMDEIRAYDVNTNESFVNCFLEPTFVHSCCIYNLHYLTNYRPEGACASTYTVYHYWNEKHPNMSLDWRFPKYVDFVFESYRKKLDKPNTVIWFTSVTETGKKLRYFSAHPDRDGGLVCPQIAYKGHTASTLNTTERINDIFEIHNMSEVDIANKTRELEFVNISVSPYIFTLTPRDKVYHWYFYYRRQLDRYREDISYPAFDRKLAEKEHKDCVKNEKCYQYFTLRIQWHTNYTKHYNHYKESNLIERYAKAMLMMIHQKSTTQIPYLKWLFKRWIAQLTDLETYTWPNSVQSPAYRLFGFEVTRDVILIEGQTKHIQMEEDEVDEDRFRLCYKRFGPLDRYTMTKRLYIRPGKRYMEINNLTIKDSGQYMCRNLPGVKPDHEFIRDYYLIVLPRKIDVQTIFHDTGFDKRFPLADHYPYIDAMNRSYFNRDAPIYVACAYVLSRGLDNYEGYDQHYSGSNYIKTNSTEFPRQEPVKLDLLSHVKNFKVNPEYDASSTKGTKFTFTCAHRYRQNYTRVRHGLPVKKEYSDIENSRDIIAMKTVYPHILNFSINNSDPNMQKSLRQKFCHVSSGEMGKCTETVAVVEGLVDGQMFTLLREFGGAIRVYLISNLGTDLSCGRISSKITLRDTDYLTVKIKNLTESYTQILKHFFFECMVFMNAKKFIVAAYNPLDFNDVVDDKDFDDKMLKIYHQSGGNPPAVLGIFRAMNLDVSWRATILRESSLRMVIRSDASRPPKCQYRLMESKPWGALPAGFIISTLPQDGVFLLAKDNVTEEDSGLYKCTSSKPEWHMAQRRALILPDLTRLSLVVETGGHNSSGIGTLENPIRTSAKDMTVICSYVAYVGQVGKIGMKIEYVKTKPYKDELVMIDQTKTPGESKGPYKNYRTSSNKLKIRAPEPDDYHKFLRIRCIMNITDLLRDKKDVMKSLNLKHVNRDLYIKYNITTGPLILGVFLNVTQPELMRKLKENDSMDLDIIFPLDKNKWIDPMEQEEGLHEFCFIAFLGIPRGWIKAWTISTLGPEQYVFTDCQLNNYENITKDYSSAFGSSRIYDKYRINFAWFNYSCLFDIQTVGVVFAGFGRMDDPFLNETQMEQKMQDDIMTRYQAMDNDSFVSLIPEKDEEENLATGNTFRMVRTKVTWNALVPVNSEVQMLGHGLSDIDLFHCSFKPGGMSKFRRIPSDQAITSLSEPVFKLELPSVQLNSSGTYHCRPKVKCTNCPPTAGVYERHLVVQPSGDNLKLHFNHKVLQMNETSKKNYTACITDRNAYMMSQQKMSIRCFYPLSPSDYIKDEMLITFKWTNPKTKRDIHLPYSRLINFTVQKKDGPWQQLSAVVQAPIVSESPSNLKVECRLTYFISKIPNSKDSHFKRLEYVTARTVQLRINAAVKFFPVFARTNKTGLLNNWRPVTRQAMSAQQFHRSFSGRRLVEEVVDIVTYQALGIPKGGSATWTFFKKSGKSYGYEPCLRMENETLEMEEIPASLKRYGAFRENNGLNFYNMTDRCTLQPQHVALAYIVYNSWDAKADLSALKKSLINSLHINFAQWMREPNGTRHLNLTAPANTSFSYAIVKISIGWIATVKAGEPWKMVLRAVKPKGAEYTVYKDDEFYQKGSLSNSSTLVEKKKSVANDSGIYTCEVSNCPGCSETCFDKRRLQVLPEVDLLKISLFEETANYSDESTATAIKDLVNKPGLELFAACRYERLLKHKVNESVEFNYILYDVFAEVQKSLDQSIVEETTVIVEVNKTVKASSVYRLKYPNPQDGQTRLQFQCQLTLNWTQDEADMTSYGSNATYTKEIILLVRVTFRPRLFEKYTVTAPSDNEAFLREYLQPLNGSLALLKTPPTEKLSEGSSTISLIASLGRPRGLIEMYLLTNGTKDFQYEECSMKKQLNITDKQIFPNITLDSKYQDEHSLSLVNTTFQCTFRVENTFLLTAIYLIDKNLTEHIFPNDSRIRIRWLTTFSLDNYPNISDMTWKSENDTAFDLRLARLNIGWNATVFSNESVRMLGYIGEPESWINCSRNYSKGVQSITDPRIHLEYINERIFSLTIEPVTRNDTGGYTCNVIDSKCKTCKTNRTIDNRLLVVLPQVSDFRFFLTEAKLPKSEKNWTGNYSLCELSDNKPFVLTGKSVQVHSARSKFVDKFLLNATVLFGAATLIRNVPSPLTVPLHTLMSNDSEEIASINLTLPEEDDFGMYMNMTFTWSFELLEPLTQNLRPIIWPWEIENTRPINIRRVLTPCIFSKLTNTSNSTHQTAFRGATRDLKTFNDKSIRLKGEEHVINFSTILTLGVPRGWVSVWTTFKIVNTSKYYKEPCVLINMVDLRHDEIPSEARSPLYRQDRGENIVNASFACSLRHETQALVIVVQHNPLNDSNQTVMDEDFEKALYEWFTFKSRIPKLLTKLKDYRVIKVAMKWNESYAEGDSVFMMGNFLDNELRNEIHCFKLGDKNIPLSPRDKFHIIIPPGEKRFYLSKFGVTAKDEGSYACNVTDRVNCVQTDTLDCPTYIGFTFRRFTIKTNETLRIYFNHHLVNNPGENFTQCLKKSCEKNYLFANQSVYVYCVSSSCKTEMQTPSVRMHLIPGGHATLINQKMPQPFKRDWVWTVQRLMPDIVLLEADLEINCADSCKTVRRKLVIISGYPPILFSTHWYANEPKLLQTIQTYAQPGPRSLGEFYRSETDYLVTEGPSEIYVPVGLGYQEGVAQVYVFYRNRSGLMELRECTEMRKETVGKYRVPPIIQSNSYFFQKGQPKLYNITFSCALTIDVKAIFIGAVNTIYPEQDMKLIRTRLRSNVLKLVRRLFQMKRPSEKEDLQRSGPSYALEEPEDTSVDYFLHQLKVGWKATVWENQTAEMYGILPNGTSSKDIQCYHYPLSNTTQTITEETEPVKIVIDAKKYNILVSSLTFRLTVGVANASDSGIYECLLIKDVANKFHKFIPLVRHRLLVLPPFTNLTLLASRKIPTIRHDTKKWTFDQFNTDNAEIIYTGQPLAIMCAYHPYTKNELLPKMDFIHVMNRSESKGNKTAKEGEIKEVVLPIVEDEKYENTTQSGEPVFHEIYTVFGPKREQKSTNSSNVTTTKTICRIRFGEEARLPDDVNWETVKKGYNVSRSLIVQDWIAPIIVSKTMITEQENLTNAAVKCENLNSTDIIQGLIENDVFEGPVELNYTIKVGKPAGWSSVFSVYHRPDGWFARACVKTSIDIHNPATRKIPANSTMNYTYVCILLPEHVALVIYTASVLEPEKNVSLLEDILFPYTLEQMGKLLSGVDIILELPSHARGRMCLVGTKTEWLNTVWVNDSITMYGLLIKDLPFRLADCLHGYTKSSQSLTSDMGFSINRTDALGYFILSKSEAQLTDTTRYQCISGVCARCWVGFAERKLIVRTNESLLSIRLRPVNWTEFTSPECLNQSFTSLSPGLHVIIECQQTLPQVLLPLTRHLISHGVKNDATTNLLLDNLVYSVDKMDNAYAYLTSTVDYQVPSAKSDRGNTFYLRCQAVTTDRVDSVQQTDETTVNQTQPESQRTEREFIVFAKQGPLLFKTRFKRMDNKQRVKKLELLVMNPEVNRESFLQSGQDENTSVLREPIGAFQVNLLARLGKPQGWMYMRLFYHKENVLYSENCSDTRTFTLHPNVVGLQAICTIQPEHVAFMAVVIQQPEVYVNPNIIESRVVDWASRNLSKWLNYTTPGNGTDTTSESSLICFKYDFALVRLRMGWEAVIREYGTIHLLAKLSRVSADTIVCFFKPKNGSEYTPVKYRFERTVDRPADQLHLTKRDATRKDSGLYYCIQNETKEKASKKTNKLAPVSGLVSKKSKNEPSDIVLYIGMISRELIVVPYDVKTEVKFTFDKAGRKRVYRTQNISNQVAFLFENSTGFAFFDFKPWWWCKDSEFHVFDNNYKETESKYTPIQLPEDVCRLIYPVVAAPAEKYHGLVHLICAIRLPYRTTPISLIDDKRIFTAKIDFDIRAPARGELTVTSMPDKFSESPLFLGTEILCSGGIGIPALNYTWVPIKLKPFSRQTIPDWPSILPGRKGGWDGPIHTFVDKPDNLLLDSNGPVLRVPKNDSYRGMGFVYRCDATNEIQGKNYTIKTKYHAVTVSICQVDDVVMTLTITGRRDLMCSYQLKGTRDGDKKFRVHYLSALLRQLALGGWYTAGKSSLSIQMLGDSAPIRLPPNDRDSVCRKLYIKEFNPPNTCDLVQHNLTDFLKTILPIPGINAVNLLLIDTLVGINEGKELTEQLILIGQLKPKPKLILLLAHQQNGQFIHFEKQLEEILHPYRTLSLLPFLPGATGNETNEVDINDPQLRINRLPLYTAICEAAGISLDHRTMDPPLLCYSVPPHWWYPGLPLFLACGAYPADQISTARMEISASLCVTDMNAVDSLTKSPIVSNIQSFKRTCGKNSIEEHILPFMPDSQLPRAVKRYVLEEDEDEVMRESSPVALCYQRVGEREAKANDPTSFAFKDLSVQLPDIGIPRLYLVKWPAYSTQAAEFRCNFTGFRNDLEVLLLFKSHSRHPTAAYHVLARANATISPVQTEATSRLIWLEPGFGEQKGVLVCQVRQRPKSKPLVKTQWWEILKLDSCRTDWIEYSEPLNKPFIRPACPRKPRLRAIGGANTSMDKTGDRKEFRCDALSTMPARALKFVYMRRDQALTICYQAGKRWNPCYFVEPLDKDCTKMAPHSREMNYYPYKCNSTFDAQGQPRLNSIEFVITALRYVDFDSRVSCHLIDPWTLGSSMEALVRSRSTSSVYRLRFRTPPQVVRLHFDSKEEIWQCQVAAEPLIGTATIHLLNVQSLPLQLQLNVYTSVAKRAQPVYPLGESLLPIVYIPWEARKFREEQYQMALLEGKKEENLSDTCLINVEFRPSIPIPGGLSHGRVKVKCELGEASENLTTQIGSVDKRFEHIFPAEPVQSEYRTIQMACSLDTESTNPVRHMSLHRLSSNKWLDYDVTLMTVTFSWMMLAGDGSQSRYQQIKPKFRRFGPWLHVPLPLLRVIVAWDKRGAIMDVSLKACEEYDTSYYYCTGRYLNGTFDRNTKDSFIIRGRTRHLAFGQRALHRPEVWYNRPGLSALLDDHVHARCIAWSTNPLERKITQLNWIPTTPPPEDAKRSEVEVTELYRLVVRIIDQYQPAATGMTVSEMGCSLTHGAWRESRVVKLPEVICAAPVDLHIYPPNRGTYPRHTLLQCRGSATCQELSFYWTWMAGPIPQLTLESRIVDMNHVTRAERLYLSNLTRIGSFVFRCSATCMCGDRRRGASIVEVFTVQDSQEDREHLLIPDPGDVEIKELLSRDLIEMEQYDSFEDLGRRYAPEKGEHAQPEDDSVDSSDKLIDQYQYSEEEKGDEEEMGSEDKGEDSVEPMMDDIASSRPTSLTQVRSLVYTDGELGEHSFRRNPLGDESTLVRPEDGFKDIKIPVRRPSQSDFADEVYRDSQVKEKNIKDFTDVDKMHGRIHFMTKGSGTRHLSRRDEKLIPDKNAHQLWLDKESGIVQQTRRLAWSKFGLHGRIVAEPQFDQILKHILKRSNQSELKQTKKETASSSLTMDQLKDKQRKHLLTTFRKEHTLKARQRLTIPLWSLRPVEEIDTDWNYTVGAKFLHQVLGQAMDPEPPDERRPLRKPRTKRLRKIETTIEETNQNPQTSKRRESNWNRPSPLIPFRVRPNQTDTNKQIRRSRNQIHYDGPFNNTEIKHSEYLTWRTNGTNMTSSTDYSIRQGLRDYFPSQRRDTVRQSLSQSESKTPWWSRKKYWRHSSKPDLSKVRQVNFHNRIDLDTVSPIKPKRTSLNLWAKYQLRNNDQKKSIQSDDSTETATTRLKLEPNFVVLPAYLRAICPTVSSSVEPTYRFVELGWYRYPVMGGDPDEIALSMLHTHRDWPGPNYRKPKRVFIYPPLRYSDAYTLDITTLRVEDYGYHSCVMGYSVGSSQVPQLRMIKLTDYPLCILAEQLKPSIRIARYIGGVLQQVKSLKARTNTTMNPTDSTASSCLTPGETIAVYCESEQFRLFCELPDQLTNGTRLVTTELQANLYFPHGTIRNQVLKHSLETVFPTTRPLESETHPGRFSSKQYKAWRLDIVPEHINATLVCHSEPHLQVPPFGEPDYWDWLVEQFNQRRHLAATRSQGFKLCVSSGHGRIVVDPVPIRTAGRKLGHIRRKPRQSIHCLARNLYNSPMNITFQPIRYGQEAVADVGGPFTYTNWFDESKPHIDWKKIYRPNEVYVMIGENRSLYGSYLVTCDIPHTDLFESFILEIDEPDYPPRHLMDITKALSLCCLPLVIMIAVLVRRICFRRISQDVERAIRRLHTQDTLVNMPEEYRL